MTLVPLKICHQPKSNNNEIELILTRALGHLTKAHLGLRDEGYISNPACASMAISLKDEVDAQERRGLSER